MCKRKKKLNEFEILSKAPLGKTFKVKAKVIKISKYQPKTFLE